MRNGIAPITVNYKHPLLNCTRGNEPDVQSDLRDAHAASRSRTSTPPAARTQPASFGLINLNGVQGGNIGAGTLADWLLNGYQDHDLTTGHYDSAPSANFNNSQFTDALNQQIGHELLFPVYRLLKGPGSNAMYDIIGWVGFVIDSYTTQR